MNRIITIGREFGSGGRELGRRLSEKLGFAYYDQEIISEIAQRTAMSEQYVQSIVEHQPSFSFPIHIGRSFYPAPTPVFDQSMSVYQEQARIITEMAQKSDCVIVGRCGDYILKEYEPFRMFVYADMESKMKRCREKASEEEKMTDKELKQHILGIDRKRAKYYQFYTGHKSLNPQRMHASVTGRPSQIILRATARRFLMINWKRGRPVPDQQWRRRKPSHFVCHCVKESEERNISVISSTLSRCEAWEKKICSSGENEGF